MRVIYTLPARRDLDAIHAYTAQQSASAATSVLRALRDAAERLSRFPHLGHPTAISGVLVIAATQISYRIFYRLLGDEVHILSIHHDARAPLDFQS
jgi:toxin ParE1/3/4